MENTESQLEFVDVYRMVALSVGGISGFEMDALAQTLFEISFTESDVLYYLSEAPSCSDSLPELTSALFELRLKKLREELDPGKKTIALHHIVPVQRDHFGDMLCHFDHDQFNVVVLTDIPKREGHAAFADYRNRLFFTKELLEQIDFVDVVLTLEDLPARFDSRTKRVLLFHNFKTNLVLPSCSGWLLEAACHYDYLITAIDYRSWGPRTPNLLGKVPPCLQAHPNDSLALLPLGYPKLDLLARYCEQHPEREKIALFCTSLPGRSQVSLSASGSEIIQTLLDALPNYRIVFRPHPADAGSQDVQRLVQQFQSEPRFSFDTSRSYLELYAKSSLMVSDYSGTALTYSLATLNPTYWCMFEHQFEDPTLEGTGVVLSNCSQLADALKNATGLEADWHTQIANFRAAFVACYGASEKRIAEALQAIALDKPVAGALTLPFGERTREPSKERELRHAIQCLKDDNDNASLVFLKRGVERSFPEDTALAELFQR